MSLHFVTNERIAETSSKGNQEKWVEGNRWYKLDQFGYEALAETLISQLLELSNCEKDYPFRFTRYQMERITAHGIERTGCSSANFLLPEQSIITLSHLYKRESEVSLRDLLSRQSSDRKRSVLYLEKRETPLEHIADSEEYQFAVELIEKVGWDAGNKKAAPVYKRDPEDGSLIIDEEGFPILDCDFDVAVNRILASDAANCFDWISKGKHVDPEVNGWSVNIKHIYDDPDLTIDPKRYSKKVVDLRSKLKTQPYVLLGDVVDFIPEKQNAYGKKITVQKSSIYQYVEIQDIGFGDFHCKEMRGWELPSRAKHFSSAGDIYIGAIWGSAIKWCYIPEGIDNVVVTNGCFRCRVKAGMEKFTPDLLAYLNSEGWGVQMRAFSRGSDGLAEICEDDAKNVIIPLLSDDVRDGLSEYVENLQRGTTTINSVVKQLIKDERIAYNDPDKRPSHIVIV